MNKLLPLLALLLLTLSAAALSAEDTTRRGPLRQRQQAPAEFSDTLRLEASEIAPDSLFIAAFDKPLRSLRETFFVTNHYRAHHMTSLTLRLTYTRHDDGTMLHSRTVTVNAIVPPGETRQLYATSWDRQYTYYYHSTRIQPRSPKAVAFDVAIEPLSATLAR